MKSYGQELESEVFNKYRKCQDSVNAEKQLEMHLALQKKAELDQMNASNLDKKRQMQALLSKEYENAMKMKDHQKHYEKFSDLQTGQMANQKVSQELQYLQHSENQKKSMIKDILTTHKTQRDGMTNQTEKDRYVTTLEDRRHLDEMEKRQQDRDMSNLSKYNQFNEFQNKIAKNYAAQVMQPKMEKDMQLNSMIRKQEMETKRKAAHDEEKRNQVKRNWAMDTRFGLEKQMKTKNENIQAHVAEHNYDESNTKAIEYGYNSLKNQDLMEKKARQQQYKDMLDNQKNTRKAMNMYGNMTGIEKQLNKNDLSAFKNYDAKTYALIPGMNSISHSPGKKVMEDKFNKKRERTHEEENHRMNQFGLTRDVTLIKNPNSYAPNAFKASNDDITGHAQSARHSAQNRSIGGPNSASIKAPTGNANMTVNNFNNHHLYQSYNPISGSYSPEKHNMNQNRSTFRYAAARNIVP
jgi:hypothetical protein